MSRTILQVEQSIRFIEMEIARVNQCVVNEDSEQRKLLRVVQQSGTYTHFRQTQQQIENCGKLILEYKKDLRKLDARLSEEKNFLNYLTKK